MHRKSILSSAPSVQDFKGENCGPLRSADVSTELSYPIVLFLRMHHSVRQTKRLRASRTVFEQKIELICADA